MYEGNLKVAIDFMRRDTDLGPNDNVTVFSFDETKVVYKKS